MVLGLVTISLISFGVVSTPAGAAPVPPDNVTVSPVPLKHLAPTQNLTKVANAIQVAAKSLTILVVVPRGLGLTQPVAIGIWSMSERIASEQSYRELTGNQFLYNDPQRDGQPRVKHLDIRLMEANPAGGVYAYNVEANVKLDPQYDVTISPLVFSLMTSCALIGNSDIEFYWKSPDGEFKVAKFATRPGRHETVREFSWVRREVTVSAKFGQPYIYEFYSGGFRHGMVPIETANLVPGVTRRVVQNVREQHQQCHALAEYNITYAPRLYSPAELQGLQGGAPGGVTVYPGGTTIVPPGGTGFGQDGNGVNVRDHR